MKQQHIHAINNEGGNQISRKFGIKKGIEKLKSVVVGT
jgi:hypothetical protein